jgi:hypothetical protein
MKKAIAFTLWTVLGLGIYLTIIYGGSDSNATAKQEQATQTYTAALSCQANAQHRIDELASLLSKIDCGNFLDAPVGIKHCVAERAIEEAIAIERAQFDSCTK